MKILISVCTISLILTSAIAIDVCGLEEVPKCDTLFNETCFNTLLTSIRDWYQTCYTTGYFIKPLEPVYWPKLDIATKTQSITLINARVSGLSKNGFKYSNVKKFDDYYDVGNAFVYNLVVDADSSIILNEKTKKQEACEEPVQIKINDLKVKVNARTQVIERCGGKGAYFNITPILESFCGTYEIKKGLSTFERNSENDQYFMKRFAELTNVEYFGRLNQLAHIITYDTVLDCY